MLKRRDSPYVAGRPKGPVVQMEARPATPSMRADVRPARPRQALELLFRLHLRRLDARPDGEPSWCRSARPISASPTRSCSGSTAGSATTPSSASARCARWRRAAHGLVLEVAFDGLHRSTRHKSGVAMRFPRISRIRWDKPAAEADRIETLEAHARPRRAARVAPGGAAGARMRRETGTCGGGRSGTIEDFAEGEVRVRPSPRSPSRRPGPGFTEISRRRSRAFVAADAALAGRARERVLPPHLGLADDPGERGRGRAAPT